MATRRGWCLLSVLLGFMVLPSCGGGIRDTPRPSQGASTLNELLEMYQRVHKGGDPDQIRQVDVTMAMLPEWSPVNGEYKAILRDLFKLELEGIHLATRPCVDTHEWCLTYLSRKPNGEPCVDSLLDVKDKVILVGTRPDGARVDLDPGFGIVPSNGRFYITVARRVAKDAAQSVKDGLPPVCRPIPLGTGFEFIAQELSYKDWGKANRQVDELERRSKAGQPLPP